jgi:hypothetical protein
MFIFSYYGHTHAQKQTNIRKKFRLTYTICEQSQACWLMKIDSLMLILMLALFIQPKNYRHLIQQQTKSITS